MTESLADLVHKFAQDCISRVPVLILGSGASAAHGIPGMEGLLRHLQSTPLPGKANPEETTVWNRLLEYLQDNDLETALSTVPLPSSLTRHIVEATWDLLVPRDREILGHLVRNRHALPLTKLYGHLFQSTHTRIEVVTPNYDRLAEYAADAGEFSHFTGFSCGHLRLRARISGSAAHRGQSASRRVNIWKVHGSIDWFRDSEGIVMGLPIPASRPEGLEPVLVTPGIEKYRLTHDEPFRSIMQGADTAMQSARAFLCIGYGFNDNHLQPIMVERCRADRVPLVLITKKITEPAHRFFRTGQCARYLALEEDIDGCRLYSAEYPEGVALGGPTYWQLDSFLTLVM